MEVGRIPSFDSVCCRTRFFGGTRKTNQVHRYWFQSRLLPLGDDAPIGVFDSDKGDSHADKTVAATRYGPACRRWFSAWRAYRDWGQALYGSWTGCQESGPQ